jgi:outer membrane protein TolC
MTYSAGLALLLSVSLVSCARSPRWTPENVGPPPVLADALQEAAKAAEEERAVLPADLPTTVSLTRDGALVMALARNRSLAVARFGPSIAATGIPEARAAFDPILLATASYGRDSRPVVVVDELLGTEELLASKTRRSDGSVRLSEFFPTGTEVFLSGGVSRSRVDDSIPSYAGSWSAEVNQSLLRGFGTDVNLVSLRQARNSAAASQHELRGFVMDLVRQVEDAYWNLLLAYETLKIREFSLELADEQLQLNEDFIEAGKLARGAQYSAESALAARKADLVDAQAALRSRTVDLIRLLNPEHEVHWQLKLAPIDPAKVERVDLAAPISVRLADLYRPELAQSRLDLANRDLDVIRTRNGLLPRLDAFASYGRISNGNSFSAAKEYLDDDDFDNYNVGLTFDMAPLNRAERARHRRAKFNLEQGEASLANLDQVIETEVRNALIEVQRQWERIPATREELQNRQEELRVEEGRFRVGVSTNIDVLLVQAALIQARLDEVTARVRYIQALTNLYYTEGTLLDRRGVGAQGQREPQQ